MPGEGDVLGSALNIGAAYFGGKAAGICAATVWTS